MVVCMAEAREYFPPEFARDLREEIDIATFKGKFGEPASLSFKMMRMHMRSVLDDARTCRLDSITLENINIVYGLKQAIHNMLEAAVDAGMHKDKYRALMKKLTDGLEMWAEDTLNAYRECERRAGYKRPGI